jgi:4-hydroxybenzoate polyprenyltransferase
MTGNGLVDLERDAAAGKSTIAVRLGREAAWRLQTVEFAGAVALAFMLAPEPAALAVPGGDGLVAGLASALGVLRLVGVPLGAVVIALGTIVLRADAPSIRERGWEIEAVGTAVLGVGWLAGTAAAARFVGGV